MIALDDVSGLVLAGGQGKRMQLPGQPEVEKGLLLLHGQPLVAWAAAAMPPGLAQIYISANRYQERYASYGVVVADDPALGHGCGPLAGVASVLQTIATPWLFVVPADVPKVPEGLFQRLLRCTSDSSCSLVYASTDRPQPLFMLVHVRMLESLRSYLHEGMRQVQRWQRDNGLAVQFSGNDNEFFNVNTQEDLCRAHCIISL